MRRSWLILTLLLLPVLLGAQDKYAPLDKLLDQFYESLLPESIEAKTLEFTRLIDSCQDSLTRQHVALNVFRHYKESKVMGDEEVAINIYDLWFKEGTVRFEGDFEKFEAEMFVDFNRQTLLGCEAPQLMMKNPKGKEVQMPAYGRTAVLFFYDTACSRCKAETKVLPSVMEKFDFPVTLYAVYCSDNRKEWNSFRRRFRIKNKNIETVHLWDPKFDSDYLKTYGVVSTPKMYLMEPGGAIIGRRLDPESLLQLIPTASAIEKVYEKKAQ